jgi:outer membrane usher protein FimD/PapC
LVLQTDARKTNREILAFFGMRASFGRRHLAVAATGGYNSGSHSKDRLTGEVQGSLQGELGSGATVAGEAALGRDMHAAYLRTGGRIDGNLANLRAEVLQRFGDGSSLQYSASIDGGFGMAGGLAAFAGRQVSDAAIAVSATGANRGDKFQVLVNDGPRGIVSADQTALIFLQPYESYKVRLRPLGTGFTNFDASDRDVATHPGRVTKLDWAVASTFIVFGKLLARDGAALANADLKGKHGIARTDAQGFFQIEAHSGDVVSVTMANGDECKIAAVTAGTDESFLPAGDLTCL